MKKMVLIFVLFAKIGWSQQFIIEKTEQLTFQKHGAFYATAFHPDGNSILASSPNFKGLFLIELTSKKIQELTNLQGAGYEPCFNSDGSKLFFRFDEFISMKKYSSLFEYEFNSGKTTLLEEKNRNLTSPQVANNRLNYQSNGIQKYTLISSMKSANVQNEPWLQLENLKIVIYQNETQKEILPNGDGSYIWASLSPDKTKLVYTFQGRTTFVCDLQGKIIAEVGRLNAPKWLNNQTIIGMHDQDNGYITTGSEIYAYSLTDNKQTILSTPKGKMAMYPIPSPDGKKIVFQTEKGELFILNVTIKNEK